MFEYLNMMGDYSQRKVANYTGDKLVVDTASVTDGIRPFETGITHTEYNNNRWIIVEAYDTKEDAQKGHDRWVKVMTSENLPDLLKDCCNAKISQFAGELGCNMDFPRVSDKN